jgi:hypothetical protein
MKNLLLLLMILPVMAHAQAKADYEHTMNRFMQFYNNNQADSIQNMFSDEWGAAKKDKWTTAQNRNQRILCGKMISFTYLGVPPGDDVQVFKAVCEKTTQAINITFDNYKKIGTLKFPASSPEIDKMLSEAK